MRRILTSFAGGLCIAGLLAAAGAGAQDVSYSPVDVSSLMPRTEAQSSIASLQAADRLFLTDVTLAQASLLSLQTAGVREFTVTTNCVVGDRMFMSPAAALPAGYMLGDIVCTATGTATAKLYLPALGIGVNYSIVARVTAFR